MYPLTTLFQALENSDANLWPAVSNERTPRADILEGEKDFRIVMDLTGVRNEDLEINVEDDMLNVKAERTFSLPEGYKVRRREMVDKVVFRRSFSLGTAVETDNIQAEMQDGVLSITLPKSTRSLPRKIEVR